MVSNVSGKTKVCGIIGDPVEHSVSPAMHNAAFSHLELDYIYVPYHVKPEGLDDAIAGMRSLNIYGLNVTVPHKIAVVPLLDEVEPSATQIGAVNTIVNNDGVLKGYNTDGWGFIRSLQAQGIEIKNKNVVILGAGGAARAVSFALADESVKLSILNWSLGYYTAVNMAAEIKQVFQNDIQAFELNGENLERVMPEADMLVNATSVGMTPEVNETPIDPKWFKSGMLVFDVIYTPLETRLLREAKQGGARTINGLDMLVWQGARAFEYWTGKPAPVDIMKEAALKALGNYQEK